MVENSAKNRFGDLRATEHVTRRGLFRLGAGGLAALAGLPKAIADPVAGDQSSVPTNLRTSLHQEVTIAAAPERIYTALLSSKQFTDFSGLPATIDPVPGGAFTMFAAIISGRNIELVPNQRIVQAWRPKSWKPGVYSVVKFELVAAGKATKVILDHTGFPEGDFETLGSGWEGHYWTPLKKYLA